MRTHKMHHHCSYIKTANDLRYHIGQRNVITIWKKGYAAFIFFILLTSSFLLVGESAYADQTSVSEEYTSLEVGKNYLPKSWFKPIQGEVLIKVSYTADRALKRAIQKGNTVHTGLLGLDRLFEKYKVKTVTIIHSQAIYMNDVTKVLHFKRDAIKKKMKSKKQYLNYVYKLQIDSDKDISYIVDQFSDNAYVLHAQPNLAYQPRNRS